MIYPPIGIHYTAILRNFGLRFFYFCTPRISVLTPHFGWTRTPRLNYTSVADGTGDTPKTVDGLDTHWTRYSCILKTESSGNSSFMMWPGLGTRMAGGKTRQ